MACTYLFSDSFDYGTSPFDTVDHSAAIISGSAHTGPYGISIAGTRWFRYAITGTPDNLSVGIWLNMNGTQWAAGTGLVIRLGLTTGEIIDVRWDGVAKTFDAYVDGVKVADGAVFVPVMDWFHLQFYAYIDNAGFIRTIIDGVADITYNGDTLPVGAAAAINYLTFYSASGTSYIDDIIVGTDDFTGDIRVEYLVPDGDTAVHDWTPSAGPASYQDIDEVPASDAEYISSDTNTDEEEMDLTDWVGTGKTPVLVSAIGRAQEAAATGESLEVGVDSNGTDDTTQHVLTSAWRYYRHNMAQNPDGPAAWDDAAIDALLLRYEAVI